MTGKIDTATNPTSDKPHQRQTPSATNPISDKPHNVTDCAHNATCIYMYILKPAFKSPQKHGGCWSMDFTPLSTGT